MFFMFSKIKRRKQNKTKHKFIDDFRVIAPLWKLISSGADSTLNPAITVKPLTQEHKLKPTYIACFIFKSV